MTPTRRKGKSTTPTLFMQCQGFPSNKAYTYVCSSVDGFLVLIFKFLWCIALHVSFTQNNEFHCHYKYIINGDVNKHIQIILDSLRVRTHSLQQKHIWFKTNIPIIFRKHNHPTPVWSSPDSVKMCFNHNLQYAPPHTTDCIKHIISYYT